MFETVECPYCGFENDMSDGTVDLPDDNKYDHECGSLLFLVIGLGVRPKLTDLMLLGSRFVFVLPLFKLSEGIPKCVISLNLETI